MDSDGSDADEKFPKDYPHPKFQDFESSTTTKKIDEKDNAIVSKLFSYLSQIWKTNRYKGSS